MKTPIVALALVLSLPVMGLAQDGLPDPLTCLLAPVRSSAIGTDRGGIVREIAVRRADPVRAGDLLVQLDDALARSDLALTAITLGAARERLQRAELLLPRNIVSRDEIEALRAERDRAAAEAERAALNLARARITAPFDGTVAEIAVAEGELTGPEPLLRLIDTSRLRVDLVFVAEAWGLLAQGDVLRIAVDLAGREVPATVTAIDGWFDASSNTFSVQAELDNREAALPAGASCRIAR